MQNNETNSASATEPEGEGAVRSSAVLAVTLSCYEWHELLNELKHGMRFVNRDTSVAVRLFEQIATQLNGARVQVVTANAGDERRGGENLNKNH